MAERRARTLDAIVGAAVDVMAEQGAAGLTLGEVARRLGMRTPSLYGYVSSRSDLCDELFRRGWQQLGDATRGIGADPAADPVETLLEGITTLVGWALDHPGYAQLMFWRPIPGWQPSPEAFAPAIASLQQSVDVIRRFQQHGSIDPEVPAEDLAQQYAVLGTGVISQQLSNEPGVPLDQGRASRHLDALTRMFAARYVIPPTRSQP